jgi:hypothetical protein
MATQPTSVPLAGQPGRAALVVRGRRLAWFTVGWNARAAGRRAGRRGPGPRQATPGARQARARDEAPKPKRVATVTDPDSRLVHTRKAACRATTPRRSPPCAPTQEGMQPPRRAPSTR